MPLSLINLYCFILKINVHEKNNIQSVYVTNVASQNKLKKGFAGMIRYMNIIHALRDYVALRLTIQMKT